MLLFFQAILAGAVIGVAAGVCTLVYDIWDMIFGDDEEDADAEESTCPRCGRCRCDRLKSFSQLSA